MSGQQQPDFTSVKGISDVRRLPRLGKIHLGIKVPTSSGNERPQEVDYFVVPPEVAEIVGSEPKNLNIMFPVSDLKIVFPQAYKWYGQSKGVKCRGNGEQAERFPEDDPTSAPEIIPCPCDNLKSRHNPKGKCNLVAHLMIILPDVSLGGVYQIDTGSYHSIIDIQSGLEYAANMVQQMTGEPRFHMIPLILTRVPRNTHGSGRAETHYTLQVRLAISLTELRKMETQVRSIPQFIVESPRLSEGRDITYDDEEFTPENTTQEPESQSTQDEQRSENIDHTKLINALKSSDPNTIEDHRLIGYCTTAREVLGDTVCNQILFTLFQCDWETLPSIPSQNLRKLA